MIFQLVTYLLLAIILPRALSYLAPGYPLTKTNPTRLLTTIVATKSTSQALRSSKTMARYSTRRAASKSAFNVRVTSYNVLSDKLASPNHFHTNNPEHLAANYRLESLKAKLDKEVAQNAVVCLQEVSNNWAGELHTFFQQRGYHFITALYGSRFNGYMGVAIAVPNESYSISSVDITRIADTKYQPRKPKLGFFGNLLKSVKSFVLKMLEMVKLYKPPFDIWDNALYRTNQMICARLKCKSTQKSFVVGTYHMPCMFKYPSVMNVHCALSSQHIRKYSNGDPFLYLGDFNIKPDSSMYKLITEGTIEVKVSRTIMSNYKYTYNLSAKYQ